MEIRKNGSKFEAIHNGVVLARSTVRASARYHGKKKLALAVSNSGAETKVVKKQEFGINKSFDFAHGHLAVSPWFKPGAQLVAVRYEKSPRIS